MLQNRFVGGVAIDYRFTRLLFVANGFRVHLDDNIRNLGRLGGGGDILAT